MENLPGIIIFIALIAIAVVISVYTSFDSKVERNQKKNKEYSSKKGYSFHDIYDFPKFKEVIESSQTLNPEGSYNNRFESVICIEEDDFTLYIGNFFYQKDVEKSKLEKTAEALAKLTPKGRMGLETSSINYNSINWPACVSKPRNVGSNYYNYYYYQKFAIIKPKSNVSFPKFQLRVKRHGLEKFKNIIELSGHPIFNWYHMIASTERNNTEAFFNTDRINGMTKLADRSYVYEAIDNIFIIKSEATILDSIERLQKNALAMYSGFLCPERNYGSKDYSPSKLYMGSAATYRTIKVMLIMLFLFFCFSVYQLAEYHRSKKGILATPIEERYNALVSDKPVYIPELMKGYTWKNYKRTRLVDAMVFDYGEIADSKRENFFQPRFDIVKPNNLASYPLELVPKIKEKLGHIEKYEPRTYEEAMTSQYKCDNMLIVDTAALWLFVSRHFAKTGDLETAFLLPYAGIISAYESANKTADAMNVDSKIQHLDAKNICAYHLLYLAVNYKPDYNLLKSIAKDMLSIARNQLSCSYYIKFQKAQLLKAMRKAIAEEIEVEYKRNSMNSYAMRLQNSKLLEKFIKNFMDDYLPFADAPYPEIYDTYIKWHPEVYVDKATEEYSMVRDLNKYFGFQDYRPKSQLISFRKIYEEYLTKLEGIAIALLCRAYEIQNGSLPENITILEDWAEESFPVDRFTNKPYELNKDTDKRLFSVGPDLTPNTKNDIRFW